jgi:hypothetical protein
MAKKPHAPSGLPAKVLKVTVFERPPPKAREHDEALLDEALMETFPASFRESVVHRRQQFVGFLGERAPLRAHQSGLPRFSVNEGNMMLKLMVTLSMRRTVTIVLAALCAAAGDACPAQELGPVGVEEIASGTR